MKGVFGLLLLAATFPAAAQFAQFDPAGNLVLLSGGNSGRPTLQGPASRLGRPGERISLSVGFTGENVQFRWYFNGQLIGSATNDTLFFDSLSASNVGSYFVIATNNFGSATSALARVELDVDRDGLGDSWELSNFGSLTNQNAAMDRDRDGTSNQLEFQDGTNPTNQLSLLPRLEVRTFGGGKVAVSPDLPAYQTNDAVVLTAIPDAGLSLVGWSGDLTGPTNPATLVLTAKALVQATFGLPLAFSLNTTNPVVTGGAGGWFGQREVTDDGQAAAAVAPPLAGSDPPFLETTVVMAREGTASFRWKIDGERYNSLWVSVNGDATYFATRFLIGVTGWQSKTIYLPAGTNRVRWTYTRTGGGWEETGTLLKPRDTAYVDRFVVTEYANPQLDADGNGLPDLWEYRYLDVTGVDPYADPDDDGVSTRIELPDGTDPNSRQSVKPRVTLIVEGQGAATVTPSLSSFEHGQSVTYNATPGAGWYFVGWMGPFENSYMVPRLATNNPTGDHLFFSKAVRAVFGMPPGTAADSPGLTWTTSPSFPWFGQSLVSHDGINAAQSALTDEPIADSDSWLQTSVTGPGTLSFFWRASSATNDYLTLLVNSVEAAGRLSGLTEWRPVVLDFPAGNYTLRWLFKRFYGYDSNALNTAWVDQVRFTPGTSAPEFIDVPGRLQGYESRDLTFRVTARGTPPITYQVLLNGTEISPPQVEETITISGVTPQMSGNWIVRAQNAWGSTDSTPIPVNILPVPANDDFAQAAALSSGQGFFSGYSIAATAEINEEPHAGWPAQASVWHRWRAPFSGGVRFTAFATNAPSYVALAAYRGTALDALTEVASQSVYAEMTNGVNLARADIVWKAVANTDYSIAIDADVDGAFYQLSWLPVAPPINDAFAARLPLTGVSVTVSGDNLVATAEPGEPPVVNMPPFFVVNASNTLWWSWKAPTSGKLWIEHQPDSTTALVSIFTGSNLTSLTRVFDPLGGTNALNVTKDVTYAISADAKNGVGGHFTFLLALDLLFLRVAPPEGLGQGEIELLGRPGTGVAIEFSPNLIDWYPWSTNTIDARGSVKFSLEAGMCVDANGTVPSAPANAMKRFFRAVRKP